MTKRVFLGGNFGTCAKGLTQGAIETKLNPLLASVDQPIALGENSVTTPVRTA